MQTLKRIYLKILRLVQRIWQTAPSALETERLDRIHNPSKYLGKE